MSNTPTINEERQFIVDSYPLFASLQRIVAEHESTLPIESSNSPPRAEQVQYYARISSLYRQAMLSQLTTVQANPTLTTESKESRLQHYSTMHSILSLTEILYFPSDGTGEGVVGEELLDWLNVVDRAPSTEEGTELSTLSQPWDSPDFFPYLTKCLLRGHSSSLTALLSLVETSHPSKPIKRISTLFVELFEKFPRSTRFTTELSFRQALKTFKSTSKVTLGRADELYEEIMDEFELEGEGQDYIESFKTLFNLLTLSTNTNTNTNTSSSSSNSLEILSNECQTWQEFLITYLIYYDPLTTRQDLPTILDSVVLGGEFSGHSVDKTLIEEEVQEKLFRGDVTGLLKTLVKGGGGDQEEGEGGSQGEWLWLATHLIDLLSHLNLPAFDLPPTTTTTNRRRIMEEDQSEGEEEEKVTLGPREEFLLSYADRLIEGDETLWRVCCEYWGECGTTGRGRIEKLLGGGGVSLEDDDEEEDGVEGEMDVEGVQKKDQKGKNVEEVLTVLGEYGMEEQVKKVCQTYAESLIEKKKYGKAIAYCVRASDSKRVDRIAYSILDEYVDQGQELFIAHVDSLPTSLLRPASSLPSPPPSPSSTSSPDPLPMISPYPLITFLSRYRDFLALYSLASQSSQRPDNDPEEVWRMKRQSSELLILLLTSGMAPRKFWAVMLLDSVGLLESQPPLVSLSETYELLRVMEEITGPIELSSSSSSDYSSNESSPPIDIFGDLDMLGRLLEGKGQETRGSGHGEGRTKRALSQLEIVRGALARHLAICCCL